ncbi:MAG: hypothetical protein MZU84_04595 [Sphingobacterium sp.]|nr:hypothetical protein [Sphingobacterium sp.]
MAQFFHTSGGFTYRPLGLGAADRTTRPKDRGRLRLRHGQEIPRDHRRGRARRLEEARLDPGAARGAAQDVEEQVRHRARLRVPRALEGELRRAERTGAYGYGLSTDWDYLQLGIYSLTTELWNPEIGHPRVPEAGGRRRTTGQARGSARSSSSRTTSTAAELFVAWKPFKHPELGEGEIGGWIPQYASNAWPGEHPHGRLRPARAVRAVPRRADARARHHRGHGPGRLRQPERHAREAVAGAGRVASHEGRADGAYRVLEVKAVIENTGAAGHAHRPRRRACAATARTSSGSSATATR